MIQRSSLTSCLPVPAIRQQAGKKVISMVKDLSRHPRLRVVLFCFATTIATLVSGAVQAQDAGRAAQYTYTLYGTPGLIDMPTAQSADDAELAATLGYFGGTTRTTLSFQIMPRLSGSFRYARIDNWVIATGENTYDRSFDLRYRLVDEGVHRPAVAIGLQDFVGTGIYSGEYIVATKQLNPQFGVTAGVGWGRFGSYNGVANPLGIFGPAFDVRPGRSDNLGGQVESGRWFRGDVAVFAGAAWRPTDRLTFKAEYSSDAYVAETAAGRDLFRRHIPLNVGVDYQISDTVHIQGYYIYGSEAGFALTYKINPKEPLANGGLGQRPTPIRLREPGQISDFAWRAQPDASQILRDSLARLLKAEGMVLEAMHLEPTHVTVSMRNPSYLARSEAIGRTARILTQVMPGSVGAFTIIPVVSGIRAVAVMIDRSDLEALEFAPDGAAQSFDRAQIADAAEQGAGSTLVDGLYPHLQWRVGPYATIAYFDPENPVRISVGAELAAAYDVAPGLTFAGKVRQRIAGNGGSNPRVSDSVLQHVRTDASIYDVQSETAITQLTVAYQTNLGRDFYGRVTAGYLERMYGGISAEVLWKPVDGQFGLGAELNYAKQRDFDQLFGFQAYAVVTGHVSGYYDFENGMHGQLDVGRYLAGDYGATITLERVFDNGWRFGAFATLTDVSFDDFGEGSFDKGLRFTVPLTHFSGSPTARTYPVTLRPLLRDGGARLSVPGRLYETVRSYHEPSLQGSWGRFWR